MKTTAIRFGTSRYHSSLSPEQILLEVGRITLATQWIRNPLISPSEPFEGVVDIAGFEITPLPHLRSMQPIPLIKGEYYTNSAGSTELFLKLERPVAHILGSILMILLGLLTLLAVIVSQELGYLVFPILMVVQLVLQRVPHQRITAKSIEILRQRLRLTPAAEVPGI